MTSTALVGPLPTVTFYGGPTGSRLHRDLPRAVYEVPRNTCDPRFAACTDHHVACDCREAIQAENLNEHRMEWKLLRDAARRALAGHQIHAPLSLERWQRRMFERDQVCLCSGCVIERACGNLLDHRDIDYRTGRVRAVEVAPDAPPPAPEPRARYAEGPAEVPPVLDDEVVEGEVPF